MGLRISTIGGISTGDRLSCFSKCSFASVKCLSVLETSLVHNFLRLKAVGVSKKLPQEAAYLTLEVLLKSRF